MRVRWNEYSRFPLFARRDRSAESPARDGGGSSTWTSDPRDDSRGCRSCCYLTIFKIAMEGVTRPLPATGSRTINALYKSCACSAIALALVMVAGIWHLGANSMIACGFLGAAFIHFASAADPE